MAVTLKTLTIRIGAILAIAIGQGLKTVAIPSADNPALTRMGKRPLLFSLATLNLMLGVAMLLSVAVLGFLHNLSRLAVLVPQAQ